MADPVSAVAKRLESLIDEIFPDAMRSQDKADTGFGFTQGYKGLVFVVSRQAKHVNLGVAHGVELERSFPLLEGSGKVHRHVKLRSLEDVANPELAKLMKAALKAARARNKAGSSRSSSSTASR
jgi:Domain of unknown function (DU1801)